jgi:hypothetical protein
MLQNTSLQRLKGDKPTTGLPSGGLVTRPRELSMTSKPQYEENRAANLTTNYGKKTFKRQ